MKKLKNYCAISSILFLITFVVNIGGMWFYRTPTWFLIFSLIVAINYLIFGTIFIFKTPKKDAKENKYTSSEG